MEVSIQVAQNYSYAVATFPESSNATIAISYKYTIVWYQYFNVVAMFVCIMEIYFITYHPCNSSSLTN